MGGLNYGMGGLPGPGASLLPGSFQVSGAGVPGADLVTALNHLNLGGRPPSRGGLPGGLR
jgi:hypothetical protein